MTVLMLDGSSIENLSQLHTAFMRAFSFPEWYGKNFDAFMGYELQSDGFKDIHGKFYESSVFEKLDDEKVEEFTKKFPLMKKQYYPCQW